MGKSGCDTHGSQWAPGCRDVTGGAGLPVLGALRAAAPLGGGLRRVDGVFVWEKAVNLLLLR